MKPKSKILILLVREALKKAGSKLALERATGWGRHQITRVLRREQESVRVSNLRSLLTYIGKSYYEIDGIKIGHSRGKLKLKAVKTSGPLLRLLGAMISDGSITATVGKNSYLIEYINLNEGLRKLRISDFKKVFGELKICDKLVSGECIGFKFRSKVIGEIFKKLGVPIGKKIKQNSPLPWVVDSASKKLQMEYIRSIFSDEGHVSSPSSGKQVAVAYSRAGVLPLKSDYREILDFAVQIGIFSGMTLPSGVKQLSVTPGHLMNKIDFCNQIKPKITLNKFKKLLQEQFKNYMPALLQGETRLLSSMGFYPRAKLSRVYTYGRKEYYGIWQVQLYRKKDVLRFYRAGGFLDKTKRADFIRRLETIGWFS